MVQPSRRGVFLSYWLNAANSDPTSWKCGVVRGPHRCSKILVKHKFKLFYGCKGRGVGGAPNTISCIEKGTDLQNESVF
jgi:hypothetical protein